MNSYVDPWSLEELLKNRMSFRSSLKVKSTIRERHKLAPHLGLKNTKKTSKCQVFFYSTRKTQKLNRIGAGAGGGAYSAKRGTLLDFQHFRHKTSKN